MAVPDVFQSYSDALPEELTPEVRAKTAARLVTAAALYSVAEAIDDAAKRLSARLEKINHLRG